MSDPAGSWGTCAFCGDPFPPGGSACPTCGYAKSVAGGGVKALSKPERFHLRFVQGIRAAIIVGAIVGLSYLMVSAAISPAAPAADPLTTSGPWTIGPANFTAISGDITGDDYIVGNYTVMGPVGGTVDLLIFNDTEFGQFVAHRTAASLYNVSGDASARLVFSAPYTDNFHLVWVNPYGAGSGITLRVYIVTNYESNALVE